MRTRSSVQYAWAVACEGGPPHEYHHQYFDPVRDPVTNEITETEYRGRRIVASKHVNCVDNADTMGLPVPLVYTVLDEFDDEALPICQHQFWTPHDAAAAIRFVDWITPQIDKTRKSWPTTVSYEYNCMVAMRRNFDHVYAAIREIEKLCIDARDLDDDVREDVIRRIVMLRTAVAEGR